MRTPGAIWIPPLLAAAWLVGMAWTLSPRGARAGEPSTPVETGGMAGFRDFAARIDEAVEARDVGFFRERARLTRHRCTAGPEEFIEPRCIGRSEGTVIEGVWRSWWRGEGFLLSPRAVFEDLGEFLRSTDNPAVYAIGDQSGRVSDYFGIHQGFFAVVTGSAENTGSLRVLTFELSAEHSQWQPVAVMEVGPLRNEDWLLSGCTDCYVHWERWTGPAEGRPR